MNPSPASSRSEEPVRPLRQPAQVAILPEAHLRVETVSAITGMCRAQIYKLMRRTVGAFPQPSVRLSARHVRWRAGDVVDWCEAQARSPS